jgi:Flp pilus assembly pilin Flp
MIGAAMFSRFRKSEDGASTVEFALIIIPLSIMLFGSLEIGYRIYAKSVVNGALREASRMASTGGYTGTQIDDGVRARIVSFRDNATVAITKMNYANFSGVGIAEPILSGTVESGEYCFKDVNNSGAWEEDQGREGLGGPEDVVYYQVNMRYNMLFPFSSTFLGVDRNVTVSANTLVSNEPFAAVVTTPAPERCVFP